MRLLRRVRTPLQIDQVRPKARGGFWLAAKVGEPASALLVESAVDVLSVLTHRPSRPGHALAHRDIRFWRLRPEGASDRNGILQERKGGSGPERT